MDNKIWNKILKFCSFRERSENEITKKLYELGIKNKDIQNAYIKELKENGIVSDSKFLKAYIQGKIRMNRWGPQKILFELQKKGFNAEEIKKNLAFYEDDIYNNCLKILDSEKIKKLPNGYEKEIKIKRYLYSKGYDTEMIVKCMKEKKMHEN